MWHLPSQRPATGVFAESFPSNGFVCWRHNSGFQQTCHIDPSLRLFVPSSLQTYCDYILSCPVWAKFPRLGSAPTAPPLKLWVVSFSFGGGGGRLLHSVFKLVLRSLMSDPTICSAISRSEVCLRAVLTILLLPKYNCFSALGPLCRCCTPPAFVVSSRLSVH
jgi:hypothetical protein